FQHSQRHRRGVSRTVSATRRQPRGGVTNWTCGRKRDGAGSVTTGPGGPSLPTPRGPNRSGRILPQSHIDIRELLILAKAGRQPLPEAYRTAVGTHRTARHGDPEAVKRRADAFKTGFGPLIRPAWLRGEPGRVWDRWIAPADWLDGSRGAAAAVFC